jgi:glyoxylase-like metal-dependent hydrolase (beta-lactamase superfamily II)
MHRRDLLKAGVGTAGTFFLGSSARGDDPIAESDPVEAIRKGLPLLMQSRVEAAGLTDKLHLVQGAGGNVAVLAGPDGATVVDSGIPDRGTAVLETVRRLAAGKPIAALINTHWHFDHAGGNATFGKAGAAIWATANTRARLAIEQYSEAFKMKSPASPPEALPTLTFDEAGFHVADEEVHLTAVPPAHTDGDLIVHFRKADVIHAGDLFNNGFYPNIDASSRGWLGGMIAAADRLLKLAGPGTRIIPGHGPLATVDDLAAYRKMLVALYDRIAPMVDAGKTVEEVILARPTKDFDPTWGKGFFNGHTFTRIAYGGLVKHREGDRK